MSRSPFAAAALFAMLATATYLPAQTAGNPPQSSNQQPPAASPAPVKHQATKPAMDAAPGSGPDKVWVNLNSAVYHCPGDRFYGKTANGRYMTEAAAKSAGAKGPRGKTCFAGK